MGVTIAGGNFNDVHRGMLKLASGKTIDVAFKKLKGTTGKKGRAEFMKEAKLAQVFHHPNIVQVNDFLGFIFKNYMKRILMQSSKTLPFKYLLVEDDRRGHKRNRC